MKSSLSEDGFTIVQNALGAERVECVSAALATLGGGYGMRNLLQTCPAVASVAEELKLLATCLLGDGVFPVRGLFFDKFPGANWDVGWHQDLSIAVAERIDTPGFTAWSVKQGVQHVQPPAYVLENMLTLRLHLDDCGADNGPLRVLRGSHLHGRLKDEQIEQCKRECDEVTCLVPLGSVLLMRPLLLHASSPAKHPCHRRVVHLEYAADPLPDRLRWFEQMPASTAAHNPSPPLTP